MNIKQTTHIAYIATAVCVAILDLATPIPATALFFGYVLIAKPIWFCKYMDELYVGKVGRPKKVKQEALTAFLIKSGVPKTIDDLSAKTIEYLKQKGYE